MFVIINVNIDANAAEVNGLEMNSTKSEVLLSSSDTFDVSVLTASWFVAIDVSNNFVADESSLLFCAYKLRHIKNKIKNKMVFILNPTYWLYNGVAAKAQPITANADLFSKFYN